MADRIKVSFGALDTAVADVQGGAATMEQRMQQLRSDIAPMLATWDGAARESYAAAQAQWDAGWQELQSALAQLGQSTAGANQGYNDTERAAMQSFQV
ncbi:WXG100 family type VII secretion target [Actinomycetospora termitidis]|uniref:ESAT-6-like protein n=1 Tax=Actinomycetospora termitidis TaxID=3053470 RepID=A0ABT7M578_9PSEU|nr:WXG100 family type VII secretion target [Actinomycetospora sp. Odt1-22]MDL5155809.1 WXG100 family type VII secretion target [Actinomycetospora sp. Odt1-22]